jgi:outer membrane protein insertion porin family/translocation and assembly module TamA
VRIVVQPAKLRSVRLGFGVEVGSQVGTRGVAGWQNKNLFGALDRVSIEGRPRLVLFPWRLETLFGSAPVLVPEVALRLEYSLPIPYEPRTHIFIQGQGSIGLEKNLDAPDKVDATTPIPGEYLVEQKVGVERKFFLSRLLLRLSHNLGFSQPFDYGDSPSTVENNSLLLSYLELYGELDLRKRGKKWDPINPTSGFFASNELQVAGYFIGGDANDVRVRPEVRFYVPLTRRVILAGRFAMGFLFTGTYGDVLDTDYDPAGLAGTDKLRSLDRDVQILDKRGLFSGGPTSNRGYGFNEIAPHRVLDDAGRDISLDADAIGGRTLWEASIELRFPIAGDLSGTGFVDTSDVTRGVGQLRIDHPHLSVGVGARYETPVGPLRVDLGVRVPYLQVLGEPTVDPCEQCKTLVVDEGTSATLFDLPLALAIAIGNAF